MDSGILRNELVEEAQRMPLPSNDTHQDSEVVITIAIPADEDKSIESSYEIRPCRRLY